MHWKFSVSPIIWAIAEASSPIRRPRPIKTCQTKRVQNREFQMACCVFPLGLKTPTICLKMSMWHSRRCAKTVQLPEFGNRFFGADYLKPVPGLGAGFHRQRIWCKSSLEEEFKGGFNV